jgi:hypothetical protein
MTILKLNLEILPPDTFLRKNRCHGKNSSDGARTVKYLKPAPFGPGSL